LIRETSESTVDPLKIDPLGIDPLGVDPPGVDPPKDLIYQKG